MKAICINNQFSLLPENLRLRYSPNCRFSISESITVNKIYVIYAALSLNGYPGYFICDDDTDVYPLWYPSNFFNIIDSRLSRYWIGSVQEDDKTKTTLFFGFFEWANEDFFHDHLIDGEAREMDLFRKYKQLMDLEFPDSAITQAASIGDQEWLICPSCLDAWKNSNCDDALVMCPICHQTFCNPRYQNKFPRIDGLILQSS